MAQVTIKLEQQLAEKVDQLIQFFGSEDLLFTKFIDFHRMRLKGEIRRIQKELELYEQRYALTSADFFDQFERGELEDSEDFILWSGIYEMQLTSRKQLEQLA
jgi:hypothetical protein